jgi:hypothetical protein
MLIEFWNNYVRFEIIMALMMKTSYSGMWRLADGTYLHHCCKIA